MNEQSLMDELRARAAADARAFREKFPDDTPNERWLDNSFSAAFPLAKDRTGFDPGPSAQPRLFDVYKNEVQSVLGMTSMREQTEADRERGTDLVQQPTPGEN